MFGIYISSNKGAATIERWNVDDPSSPVLDTSWGVNGVIDLRSASYGLGANTFLNGLTVDTDGTIYATGGVNATDRGDAVFKISADGQTLLGTATVAGAMDDALYEGSLYVTEFEGPNSTVAVLNETDLSSLGAIPGMPIGPYNGSPNDSLGYDCGYSGIDIGPNGNIYVAEQYYNVDSAGVHDRILVSSPLADPAPILSPIVFSPQQLDATHGQATAGQTVSITMPYTDVPNDGPHTVTINWGDSTSSTATATELAATTGTATLDHAYAAFGTYTITETVRDDGTGIATQTFTVSVVPGVGPAAFLQPCPTQPGMQELVVLGTQHNDNIRVNLANSHGQITYNVTIRTSTGADCGPFGGSVFRTGSVVVPGGLCKVVVYGLDGNDEIRVDSGNTGVPAWLFAGDGNDLLEVDHGDNLLVGGGGNDMLIGGDGRDILIGGGGCDVLLPGCGDDLVIAGSTDYDANEAALAQIMAEWDRTDLGFMARVNDLTGATSGGLNGPYLLTAGPGGTVHDDGSTDLVLAWGRGADWLFVDTRGASPHDWVFASGHDLITQI